MADGKSPSDENLVVRESSVKTFAGQAAAMTDFTSGRNLSVFDDKVFKTLGDFGTFVGNTDDMF